MYRKRTYFVDNVHGRYMVSDGPHEGQTWEWSWDRVLSLPAQHVVLFAADLYRQLACHSMLHQGSWPDGLRLDCTEEGSPRLAFGESPIYARWVMGGRSWVMADAANLVPGAQPDSGWRQQLFDVMRLLGCGHDAYTASGMGGRLLRNLCRYDEVQSWSQTCGPLALNHPRAGRCEVYRLPYHSDGNHHYWDMSLAYLTAAAGPLPARLVDGWRGNSAKLDSSCIADVVVKTDVPLYPYRMRHHDDCGRVLTVFPTGRFRTVLCGRELLCASESGHIESVNLAQRWELGCVLLPYVQRIHQAIEGADSNVRRAIKLIGLAGLGATSRRESRWLPVSGHDPSPGFIGDYYRIGDDGEIIRLRRVYGETYRESPGGWADDSRPQLWSWIVSQVRWQISQAIRALGANCYYCDTDGLIVDGYGHALMRSWSQRWPEHRWRDTGRSGPLSIFGWRRYLLGDEPISGIPTHAQQIGVNSWTWQSIEKWDEAMNARRMPDGREIRRTTRLLSTYEHGTVQDDGRVVPFHLDDPDTII